MKILITGHKGFVGRNFWKALDTKKNLLFGVDIKDGEDCRTLFQRSSTKFDLIIHCAALVGGRETIDNNPLALAQDLSLDAELFLWALKTKPKKIVYFSSSAVYPTALQVKPPRLLHESDVKLNYGNIFGMPDMTYGWAKLTGELLAKQYAEKYGGKIFVFRPFSGYGADQDLDYPFPSFIARAKNRETPFIIWGNGEQVRDFIHISDIVNATLYAVENNISQTVNLGTGIPTSLNHLAKMIAQQVGYNPKFKHLIKKPTGVSYRVANVRKLKKFYVPKISLEEGIHMALHR